MGDFVPVVVLGGGGNFKRPSGASFGGFMEILDFLLCKAGRLVKKLSFPSMLPTLNLPWFSLDGNVVLPGGVACDEVLLDCNV